MVQVVWTFQALEQLDAAAAYIHQFSPGAASRVAARIYAAGDSPAELPDRGRPVGSDYRELVAEPPYIITYGFSGASVEILTVRHGARRRT